VRIIGVWSEEYEERQREGNHEKRTRKKDNIEKKRRWDNG
jgi:hypothetical protein